MAKWIIKKREIKHSFIDKKTKEYIWIIAYEEWIKINQKEKILKADNFYIYEKRHENGLMYRERKIPIKAYQTKNLYQLVNKYAF